VRRVPVPFFCRATTELCLLMNGEGRWNFAYAFCFCFLFAFAGTHAVGQTDTHGEPGVPVPFLNWIVRYLLLLLFLERGLS
jgi:hypothetical protein